MKKRMMMVLAVLLLTLTLGIPLVAHAGEGLHSITVVKYMVPQGQDLPETPIGAEVPNGTFGQGLIRMAGVSYRVVRMERQGAEYVPLTGAEAFSVEVSTNESGIAFVGDLPAGIYQVIELDHPLIPIPDAPVTFHLPLNLGNPEVLTDIFVYPKSNVVLGGGGGGSPGGGGDGQAPGRLPQTSGNIGSIQSLLLITGGILALGALGVYLTKRKGI